MRKRVERARFVDRFPDVKVEAHLKSPTVLEIVNFSVPKEKRGHGYGTKAYAAYEKSLPRQIRAIELLAADTGSGNTDNFWLAQGFDYKYQSEEEGDLSYEAEHTMTKKM